MESEPTRSLELMIGLPDVVFLGLEEQPGGELRVHVEGRSARAFCASCGIAARVKERPLISLIDLQVYARRSRLAGTSDASPALTLSARRRAGPRRTSASRRPGWR